MAQSAAAGWSAGIHFKSSVQRQPEDSAAWRVGLLPVNTLFNHRAAALFFLTLCLETLGFTMTIQLLCTHLRVSDNSTEV